MVSVSNIEKIISNNYSISKFLIKNYKILIISSQFNRLKVDINTQMKCLLVFILFFFLFLFVDVAKPPNLDPSLRKYTYIK